MTTPKLNSYYAPLFDHMAENYDLTLLDSDMDEICRVVASMQTDDHERWLFDVLTDFRIPFDNNKQGLRSALTQWMRDRIHSLPIVHGVNCPQVAHTIATGYLHAPDDDRAYNVDGVNYCGRCHQAL
jgi:hypothetical protein